VSPSEFVWKKKSKIWSQNTRTWISKWRQIKKLVNYKIVDRIDQYKFGITLQTIEVIWKFEF
jgi:hypothetical protein